MKRMKDGDYWAFELPAGIGVLRVRSAAAGVCAVYGGVFFEDQNVVEAASSAPIAFNCECQVDHAKGDFRWLANEPLTEGLKTPIYFWRRIVGNADQVNLDCSDGTSRVAPISEAEGLERSGGYGPKEIAERLQAWLDGNDKTMADNARRLATKPWVPR
jgi:hypothetical protein